MINSLQLLAILLIAVTMTSCSRQKTVTSEELRSTLKQAASLASESEAFIDYVLQKRATENYARGHLQFLVDEAKRTAKESYGTAADESTQRILSECQSQLDRLVESLQYANEQSENPDKLQIAKQRVANARKALEKAEGSL